MYTVMGLIKYILIDLNFKGHPDPHQSGNAQIIFCITECDRLHDLKTNKLDKVQRK